MRQIGDRRDWRLSLIADASDIVLGRQSHSDALVSLSK